ncbi:ATP-NAD kinase-like domain-containing protein [Mycena leptocephala]|nr:ATP-NAD kinase-like domain-containing protein [Mycena leptocephala]
MDAIRSFLSHCWPFSSRGAQYDNISQWDLDVGTTRMSDQQELIFQDGAQITMTILETGIPSGLFSRSPSTQVEVVPFLHILFAGVSLTPGTHKFQLRQVSADVSPIQSTAMLKWVSDAQAKAYTNNMEETVEPIFAAAGCIVHVQYTGPASSPTNAANIARNVDLAAYDALVPVSGDGIVNELINGLASRPDARTALRVPIAPIPAGSGNACQPIPLDICSVTQGDTRIYSFLSQAFGLLADLDMGTEWMRWIGGVRFTLGYLWGALTGRRYNVELTLKIVESSKQRMADAYNAHQPKVSAPAPDVRMPALAFGTTDTPLPLGTVHDRLEGILAPGWHTFRTPVQFIVAGKLPWLSRDSMMIPLAQNDGLIDVVVIPPRGALESIKAVDGQEEGRFIRLPDCYYYKVEAYRCTPLERSGYISIDGESIPYKPFQVENHARLARIMSIETRWKGLERVVLE